MAKSDLHKSFELRPTMALDAKTGEILDLPAVLADLRLDLEDLAALAEWHLASDGALLTDLATKSLPAQNNSASRRLGVTLPQGVTPPGSGTSRFQWLFGDRVVTEARSWLARREVTRGESERFVSSGWRRTANAMRPSDLTPKVNLGAVDGQYASLTNDPLAEGHLDLKLVVRGRWRLLRFEGFPRERFADASRFTLPVVRVAPSGQLKFTFVAVYDYLYQPISAQYCVAVDVGVTNCATVGVYDRVSERLVYSTTLSRRVHSLANSIEASERQKHRLRRRGRHEEAAEHRRAASRKKRELAIIAAQEVAAIAHEWSNALVAVEDLSWIRNTMEHGRWNRGEFVKWLTHFVELNGSRVLKVSAKNTSQLCHLCGAKVVTRQWHTAICGACGVAHDRDVNATGNIAQRLAKSAWPKTLATRARAKNPVPPQKRRTPPARESLKHPGRDRTKTTPTPRRVKKRSGEVSHPISAPPQANWPTVVADQGEIEVPLKTAMAAQLPGKVESPPGGRICRT